MALGPVSSDSGLYDWAVVTDNNQLSLFVLARDVATFEQEYDADVTALLKDMGFTSPRNTPIPTVQDGCAYASEPPSAAAIVATAAAAASSSSKSSKSSGSDGDCKAVSPLAELDLDAWVEHTWYIQQQQVTGYQSAEDLYCVTATYDVSGDNDHDNRTYVSHSLTHSLTHSLSRLLRLVRCSVFCCCRYRCCCCVRRLLTLVF